MKTVDVNNTFLTNNYQSEQAVAVHRQMRLICDHLYYFNIVQFTKKLPGWGWLE